MKKGKEKKTWKGPKPKKNEMSESPSDEDRHECLFCSARYGNKGKGCIRCSVNLRSGHDVSWS